MNNSICQVSGDHQWVEIHREPTGPLMNWRLPGPKFDECTYIKHDYCSICRQSRRVEMPSGSICVDREIGKSKK